MDLDFTQFSPELRQEISAASRLELPKNEVLVCEGDRMHYLPLLGHYNEVMDTIRERTFQNIEARVTNYLGTPRVVISSILKKMEHESLLKLRRGRIILENLKASPTNLNNTDKE